MDEAARWYLASAAVGAAGLAPAAALYGGLRSGGVLLARPLGLALLALGGWWWGWIGLAPYGTVALAAALALIAAAGAAAAWRRPAIGEAIRSRWRLLLAGEAIFLAIFVLLALARAQAPDASGTEKPMDLMLLVAVHRAEAMPPPDPWFAGEPLSYHYLGHLAADAVGRLAGVGPGIAFNLGVAQTGAMAGLAIFGLAGDALALSPVRRRASRWIAGGLAAVALLWVAPLSGLLDVAGGSLGGGGLDPGRLIGEWWWWWDATRVLPGPIAEFPAFSLLLGDPHAHVFALPLALAAAALALEAFAGAEAPRYRGGQGGWRRLAPRAAPTLLAGALFAALCLTNAWDALTYGALWFGAAALARRRAGRSWPLALAAAALLLAPSAAAALVLAAPFLASFGSAPAGVALVTTEATGPGAWLLIWAVPLLPLAAAALLLRPGGSAMRALGAAELAVAAIAAWALAQALGGHGWAIGERGGGWLLLAALAAAVGAASAAAARAAARRDRALEAWLALAAFAAALTLALELVNIETGQGGRFNAVFKLWYHLWTLAGLAGGVAAAMAIDRTDWRAVFARRAPAARLAAAGGALALAAIWAASLLYAPAMALSRAQEGQARGLDALAHLERRDPGLAAAAAFAASELDPARHVLLQAVGDAYTPGSYLASASGVPTVLGWPNHERNWRGPEALAGRAEAVARLYALGATPEAARLAAAHGVTHVYLGYEERARHGPDVASRFGGWPVAFEAHGARIVAVPPTGGPLEEGR